MPIIRSMHVQSCAGAKLYLNEELSDVVIEVQFSGSIWRYPAHSLILSATSDVMKIMMKTDLLEKKSSKIIITDCNPASFRQFLRFLYMGDLEISDWRDVLELLTVAHKYQVLDLVIICEQRLILCVDLTNACVLHEIAKLYSLTTLKEVAMKMILDGGFVIFATEGFENLTASSVHEVLNSRNLNIESECYVLNALRQWALTECCRRELAIFPENIISVMEPFLRHIKFSYIPAGKRTFLPETVVQKYQHEREERRIKFFVPTNLHNQMISLKFVVELGSFSAKSCMQEPLNCLKFSVDAPVFLVGFRIVGMFKHNFTFGNGSPLLILSKEGTKHSSVQFNLNSLPWKGGAAAGEYVWKEIVAYFPHPARVDPFTSYTLTVKYGNLLPTKWPRTRIETNRLCTMMGIINMYTFGQCAGITELFLFPATFNDYS